MTEVRSMKNEDLLAYRRLCSICYTYPDGEEAPGALSEEQLRIRRGVFDEQGNLLSAMMQIPYEVRFEGQTAKLVGIGGVVTDPAARSRGAIRAIFEKDLPRLYQEGHVLSALYPFSFRFYGKFGYTWAKFGRNYSIPRSALRSDLCRAEEILRVLPEADDQGMAAVYEACIADKNLAILRTEAMWKELRSGLPWTKLKHAYVLRIGGRPVAYWVGQIEKENGEANLRLLDLAWTCQGGLEAAFAMLRGMNEIETIRLQARSGFEPALLCDEPWDVIAREECQGMVRVMNVERVLAMLPAPVLPGTLTIEVTDGQIPANCGRFTVTCDGYGLTVVRDEKATADIRCNIQGLTALVMGRHSFRDAVAVGVVAFDSHQKERFAQMLFSMRALHLNWNF